MTTGLKIGIGALTSTGVIGGTAGVSYLLSQPKNLRQLLEKEGIKPLDTEAKTNDKQWTELAKKHNGDQSDRTKNNIEITKIEELEITGSGDSINFSALKNKCKQLLDKPITNDAKFTKLKDDTINWCTEKSSLLETTIAPSVTQSQDSRTSAGTRDTVSPSIPTEGRDGAVPEGVPGG